MARNRDFVAIPTIIVFSTLCFYASAQQAQKKAEQATGSVTGTVTCADTNAPGRFAVVTLERVPAESADSVQNSGQDLPMNATATTDLEGRFVLDRVPVGRYFVVGILSGYIGPLARFDHDDLTKLTEQTRKDMLKAIPTVMVEANQVAQASLRLEHASEVGGTVLYDDGSPAINLTVKLLRKKKDGSVDSMGGIVIAGSGSQVRTDDRGRYRIYGVPPGDYSTSVSIRIEKTEFGGLIGNKGISIGSSSSSDGEVVVYNGNTFRGRDAAIAKVGEGEQVGGVDITIPLSQLHPVRGSLTAKRDGHPLSRGHVALLYADDRIGMQNADIDHDGNFLFPYVPDGKYILSASGGADVEFITRHEFNSNFTVEKVMRAYGEVETPITVSAEMSGLELAVPDAAPKVASQ